MVFASILILILAFVIPEKENQSSWRRAVETVLVVGGSYFVAFLIFLAAIDRQPHQTYSDDLVKEEGRGWVIQKDIFGEEIISFYAKDEDGDIYNKTYSASDLDYFEISEFEGLAVGSVAYYGYRDPSMLKEVIFGFPSFKKGIKIVTPKGGIEK